MLKKKRKNIFCKLDWTIETSATQNKEYKKLR